MAPKKRQGVQGVQVASAKRHHGDTTSTERHNASGEDTVRADASAPAQPSSSARDNACADAEGADTGLTSLSGSETSAPAKPSSPARDNAGPDAAGADTGLISQSGSETSASAKLTSFPPLDASGASTSELTSVDGHLAIAQRNVARLQDWEILDRQLCVMFKEERKLHELPGNHDKDAGWLGDIAPAKAADASRLLQAYMLKYEHAAAYTWLAKLGYCPVPRNPGVRWNKVPQQDRNNCPSHCVRNASQWIGVELQLGDPSNWPIDQNSTYIQTLLDKCSALKERTVLFESTTCLSTAMETILPESTQLRQILTVHEKVVVIVNVVAPERELAATGPGPIGHWISVGIDKKNRVAEVMCSKCLDDAHMAKNRGMIETTAEMILGIANEVRGQQMQQAEKNLEYPDPPTSIRDLICRPSSHVSKICTGDYAGFFLCAPTGLAGQERRLGVTVLHFFLLAFFPTFSSWMPLNVSLSNRRGQSYDLILGWVHFERDTCIILRCLVLTYKELSLSNPPQVTYTVYLTDPRQYAKQTDRKIPDLLTANNKLFNIARHAYLEGIENGIVDGVLEAKQVKDHTEKVRVFSETFPPKKDKKQKKANQSKTFKKADQSDHQSLSQLATRSQPTTQPTRRTQPANAQSPAETAQERSQRTERAQLQERIDQLTAEKEELQQTLTTTAAEKKTLKLENNKLTKKVNKLEKERDDAQDKVHEHEEELEDVNSKLVDVKSQLQQLKRAPPTDQPKLKCHNCAALQREKKVLTQELESLRRTSSDPRTVHSTNSPSLADLTKFVQAVLPVQSGPRTYTADELRSLGVI